MKIELRNLKHFASGSEETHCYTGTIYVDGKPAFHASNNGHGGCDMYHRVDGYTGPSEKEIDAFLAKSRPMISSGTRPDGSKWELFHSLEIEIGEQINQQLAAKALRSKLNRRIMALGKDAKTGQPALFEWPTKFKPIPANIDRLKQVLREKGSEDIVLNGLPVTDASYQRALALI